ncbi:MAG: sulfotransferase family protein [Planctomycetota bacterium]
MTAATSAKANGKLFGIGLSRTGTKTLATALNHLGIRTIWYPHDAQTFAELAMCKYRLSILEQYDAVTDTPVVPIFPQLDAEYPGSKFILTVRDVDSWLMSCATLWAKAPVAGPPAADADLAYRYKTYINSTVYGCMGFHAERFRYVYQRHVCGVMAYFQDRPDDLLVVNLTEQPSWELLCRFVDRPVPDADFPHVNSFTADTLH